VGLIEYSVVYAADNASLTVLKDLLVNGEVKETMEAFGLGIGKRDIYVRECHHLPVRFVVVAMKVIG
jgi:hypothetical protein